MDNTLIPDNLDMDQNPIINEIRKCQEYENITVEEVEEIWETLKEFSILCYTAFERL